MVMYGIYQLKSISLSNIISKKYEILYKETLFWDSSPVLSSLSSIEITLDVSDLSELEREQVYASSCAVVVENKFDYHYEVIESIFLQYPLPWESLGCKMNDTVRFDVALAFNHKHAPAKGEREEWEQYFLHNLKGRLRHRKDGTLAYIGELVSYTNYTRKYNAMIGVSCDSSPYFHQWLKRFSNAYCVLHGICEDCAAWELARSCFLTPMHENQCYFFPSDLPHFDNRPPPIPSLNICISGSGKKRNYSLLADALAKLKPSEVHVKIFQRSNQIPAELKAFNNVSDLVEVIQEPGYIRFHEAISKCHILLPLVDPSSSVYFQGKKLSGSLPIAVAHKIPTVMHVALANAYKNFLSAPVMVYNDSESFVSALSAMVYQIQRAI